MSRPVMVRFELPDSEDRQVLVTAKYYPPADSYYSRSFGNWLPPESEDVEIFAVAPLEPGADCAEVEADEERIYEGARIAAGDEREDF